MVPFKSRAMRWVHLRPWMRASLNVYAPRAAPQVTASTVYVTALRATGEKILQRKGLKWLVIVGSAVHHR